MSIYDFLQIDKRWIIKKKERRNEAEEKEDNRRIEEWRRRGRGRGSMEEDEENNGWSCESSDTYENILEVINKCMSVWVSKRVCLKLKN